ncbi:MAG: PspA/IM30 family protein [Candidatus Kapaibacteriales bacterium]
MGIFSRIADIFKSNVNDALDKAEDPEKMLRQMVLEMEQSVNKATLSVGQAIANERGLERKYEKSKKESEDWEAKARQALQQGREDLATRALEKKAIADKNLLDLGPILQQASTTTTKLRDQLNQLKSKLDEAKSRQSTLIARSQAAKAQKELSKHATGTGSDSFSKFDRLEEKIEKTEAEADAFGELAGDSDLDSEFKKLNSSSAADEMERLKREMGLLPGDEQKQLKQ